LAAKGITLTPLGEEHLTQRSQWTSDDELARLMGVDVEAEPVESPEAELENNREWLLHRLYSGARVYAIGVEDRYIGDLDLFFMPMERLAQLTLFIGEKECWGKGYGTEAVDRVLRMVFTWAPPTRAEREAAGEHVRGDEGEFVRPEAVVVDVAPGNERALRFWQKLGFTEYDSDETGSKFLRLDRETYLKRGTAEGNS
jgi:RimJ/RimL family protein N-acetyltransferase